MPYTTNPQEFQKSITDEIKALQNRVRNLIGDANWGEEGRYKEAVLSNVINNFLPSNVSLGTGFIIDKTNTGEIVKSTQIDIIVYDSTYPVLFSSGDIVITTPANVIGIIEVKTRIKIRDLQTIINKATENGKLVGGKIFNGIFAFDSFDGKLTEKRYTKIEECLRSSQGIVNYLSIGKKLFIKYWDNWPTDHDIKRLYRIYGIEDYSFAYFISNLLECTSKDRLQERGWFQYPIEGTKEQFKLREVICGTQNI
jgi:hypothetical protein